MGNFLPSTAVDPSRRAGYKGVQYAVRAALVAVALAGCTGSGDSGPGSSPDKTSSTSAAGDADQSVNCPNKLVLLPDMAREVQAEVAVLADKVNSLRGQKKPGLKTSFKERGDCTVADWSEAEFTAKPNSEGVKGRYFMVGGIEVLDTAISDQGRTFPAVSDYFALTVDRDVRDVGTRSYDIPTYRLILQQVGNGHWQLYATYGEQPAESSVFFYTTDPKDDGLDLLTPDIFEAYMAQAEGVIADAKARKPIDDNWQISSPLIAT